MSVTLRIKVTPKASHNRIQGWLGEQLKISVTTAPEKGKANNAIMKLLARQLDIPQSAISIVSGQGNPGKTLSINGIPADELHLRIAKLLK